MASCYPWLVTSGTQCYTRVYHNFIEKAVIKGLGLARNCHTGATATNYPDDIMMTSSNGNIFRVTGPLCGEFTGPGEFPTQRPVTRSFDIFFDLDLNKQLSKQSRGWWFETPSGSLWRQCNDGCVPWNRISSAGYVYYSFESKHHQSAVAGLVSAKALFVNLSVREMVSLAMIS